MSKWVPSNEARNARSSSSHTSVREGDINLASNDDGKPNDSIRKPKIKMLSLR